MVNMSEVDFQKRRKSLLFISSSGQIGGGPRHILLLVKELKDFFKVYVACPENTPFYEILKDIKHVQLIGIKERAININDLLNLRFRLKKYSIDIVHSHGKGAGVIGRTLALVSNVSLVHTFHGIHIKCHSLITRAIYIFYENLTGWIDKHKIFVSKGEFEEARSNHVIHSSCKYSIIYNAVANIGIEQEKKIDIRSKYKINRNIVIVTSLCRLETQKNIFEILEISKLCRENIFLILGTGSLRRDLKRKLFEENITNVIMPGNVNNPIQHLRESDIFLSTSLYEGHPISVLEAMSVGLPIIVSDVTGNSETIINGESGYLYEIGNTLAASNHIHRLTNNCNLRKLLGENAKGRQKELFSISRMIKEYMKIYSNLA